MHSRLSWIEALPNGRLAIMARPRAGEWLHDEISGWATEDIDVVVNLLEREEVLELKLEAEGELCSEKGIEFVSFPIHDRGVPASIPKTLELVQRLVAKIEDGQSVAIHCRAGIGRSALIAACVLVCNGIEIEKVFDLIAAARGVKVPDTDEQVEWLRHFAKCQP
jgi:protein-tyrosine phosphatase